MGGQVISRVVWRHANGRASSTVSGCGKGAETGSGLRAQGTAKGGAKKFVGEAGSDAGDDDAAC